MQEPFPNFPTEPPQKPAGEPLPPQEETPAPPTEQPVPPVQNPLPPVQNKPVPPMQNPLPPVQGMPQNNPIPPVQNPLPPVQDMPQNNPVPPMQNPIPNWYQNQQPTMGNWQIPPQVPPAPAAKTASDTGTERPPHSVLAENRSGSAGSPAAVLYRQRCGFLPPRRCCTGCCHSFGH